MSTPGARLAPRRRRWGRLVMGIGACVVLVGVVAMIIILVTGQSNRLLSPPSADPELFHLLDPEGRVAIQLPTSWWETTGLDAGGSVSDDTGDWLVAALSAASDAPRQLALWLDAPPGSGDGPTGAHADFLAATCSDANSCTPDAAAAVTVDGRPGLRQTLRFADGHLGVITTVATDQWLIFVMVEGPDDAAGELLMIADSIRLIG